MSSLNGPTLLRPPRMDYNRMNSFLEYPLCNRGSQRLAPTAPALLPPSSASAVDSYAGRDPLWWGAAQLCTPAELRLSGPTTTSALGVPFPSSATSGYSPAAACSAKLTGLLSTTLWASWKEMEAIFHPSSYGAQLGPCPPMAMEPLEWAQGPTLRSPIMGTSRQGALHRPVLISSPRTKESACASETSTPTARPSTG